MNQHGPKLDRWAAQAWAKPGRAALFTVLFACLVTSWATALETGSASKATAASQHQREGSQLVDVLGHFRVTGDRATFYPLDGQGSYAGLENLGLERVTQLITDSSDPLTWQVSGTITEFRGSNYILISKAILKSQAGPVETPGTQRKVRPVKKT